jgi:glycine/D-amino acid oxidase-like deaminating enzyme
LGANGPSYDVLIVGGGFLGSSTAYYLARAGARTLVLDAGDIGGGTSAACSGRAQTCEGHLDPTNIALIRDGLARHDTLEEELGASYDWRRAGILLLIRSQAEWARWHERAAQLTPVGIPTEVIDRPALQEAEPAMDTRGMLGAAFAQEGMLDPLKFTRAYASAAERHGARFLNHQKVVEMQLEDRRIVGVKTARGDVFHAGSVAIMAGAWEAQVASLAGVEAPVRFTQAEAFITEPIPPIIHNNVEIADFYATIHGKARAVAIGVHPESNGTLGVSEAVTRTDELHTRVSAWGLLSMAREVVKLYPALEKVRMIRSWARPTSFTPDEEPLVGWAPQLDNLYLASSLVETITTVPILCEAMALQILRNEMPLSLETYSPARFTGGWSWE